MSAATEVLPAADPRGPRERIVLFDGVCAFCHAGARWVAARDRGRRFAFAPLQGDTAAELRARHPEIPRESETLVLVEVVPGGERVTLRSRAVLRVLAELDTPWRHLALLRVLPLALTDLAYRIVASLRYRLFGRLDRCPLPAAGERDRFLP